MTENRIFDTFFQANWYVKIPSRVDAIKDLKENKTKIVGVEITLLFFLQYFQVLLSLVKSRGRKVKMQEAIKTWRQVWR